MLFSSIEFIFFFLPIMIGLVAVLKKKWSIGLIVLGSLIFYGKSNIEHLFILCSSVIINYQLSKIIYRNHKILLISIFFNLSLLCYFKYAFFLIDNLNLLNIFEKIDFKKQDLPLGISFFTFQQIAFLVDAYYKKAEQIKLSNYTLFVSFFPHSIAGPLVQYKEISPQFNFIKINLESLSIGFSIFIIGLFKKIVFADNLAPLANVVFDNASTGNTLTFLEAWVGSIAYSLQLYFDFSGYSDMAIGLARIFNIRFPINFYSPYKATSIIDFWRRWHMTLSNFLKNYLYLPLGGNRSGAIKRLRNILITMVLGGLWHGANWTFIVWGMLHGFFLIINHIWREWSIKKIPALTGKNTYKLLSWVLTLTCVMIGWVFFRANNVESAFSIVKSLFGINGISLSPSLTGLIPSCNFFDFNGFFSNNIFNIYEYIYILIFSLFVCFGLPNMAEIFKNYFSINEFNLSKKGDYFFDKYLTWDLNIRYAMTLSAITVWLFIALMSSKNIEFLYFNF